MAKTNDDADKTAGLSSLRPLALRRPAAPGPTAEVVQLRVPAAQPMRTASHGVFETVLVVDLPQLRARLRRQRTGLSRALTPKVFAPEREALLDRLDALHASGLTDWPDVAVVRWPASGEMRTHFAVVGRTIYLSAHLAPHWADRQEPPVFFETLAQALAEFSRGLTTRGSWRIEP